MTLILKREAICEHFVEIKDEEQSVKACQVEAGVFKSCSFGTDFCRFLAFYCHVLH